MFQGTGDGQFLALDARTGKTLWSTDNQAATLAGPISYEIGGEQYVAVLGGYGGSFFLIDGFRRRAEGNTLNGRVYAFKLGGTRAAAGASICRRRRCPSRRRCRSAPRPTAAARSSTKRNCTVCHGVAAMTGGVLPDLRRSITAPGCRRLAARRSSTASWRRWECRASGSTSSAEDAELIRAYVARQAAMLYAAEAAR